MAWCGILIRRIDRSLQRLGSETIVSALIYQTEMYIEQQWFHILEFLVELTNAKYGIFVEYTRKLNSTILYNGDCNSTLWEQL